MRYPRVLIVVLGKINAADAANNGLLLRNLFGNWPKENLAQIFSSADNGDAGYFSRYYQLNKRDRCWGSLFYSQKSKHLEGKSKSRAEVSPNERSYKNAISLKKMVNSVFVDSGLYELVFRPKISNDMAQWVKDFNPDIIFAQGYCLSFAWLPALLADHCKIPVAYYPTDDWPSAAYRSKSGGFPVVSWLVGRSVEKAARKLIELSSVRLAFNPYMQEEYAKRYAKKFEVLMHGDALERYLKIRAQRLAESDECWVVTTGIFNESRRPLLDDLNEACGLLVNKGVKIRATVFPVNMISDIDTGRFQHVEFLPCPSHEELVAILQGADILYLPERFDKTAKGIKLSVSSKAHLFMYSGKPIVVYSDAVTGISRYASEEEWATVVTERSAERLAIAFEKLITDKAYRDISAEKAMRTAMKNHNLKDIQCRFDDLLIAACNAYRYRSDG